MHFMDDCFVNLGEEVILTLLWQSGASESSTVSMFCYSFMYLLLTVQMRSFARRMCVFVCVCLCVCAYTQSWNAALCNNRPTNCGLRRGLNDLFLCVWTSNSTKTEVFPLLHVAQNYTVRIPTHFASTSHIGLYYIWNYTPDALMLEKEKWCIKSWGVKTFEQNGDSYFA